MMATLGGGGAMTLAFVVVVVPRPGVLLFCIIIYDCPTSNVKLTPVFIIGKCLCIACCDCS